MEPRAFWQVLCGQLFLLLVLALLRIILCIIAIIMRKTWVTPPWPLRPPGVL